MLTFGSCVTFVLSVDVSSLAKISADAVARWVTLAAVEKVGRVPCHTFLDCCKNVISKPAPVVYGMMREMIYSSFIPYWAPEGCRG